MRSKLPLSVLAAQLTLVAMAAIGVLPGSAQASGSQAVNQTTAGAGAAETEIGPGKPPRAVVRIVHIGHLRGRRAEILSTVPVVGTLRPYAPHERVEVSFYLGGKRIKRAVAPVRRRGKGGVFRARIVVRNAGRYAVAARHAPSARLRGDRTVRKRWGVRFPALAAKQCGRTVAGFKHALHELGYIVEPGRCLGEKTQRGVLAYRRVNGMEQSFAASAELVKRVFAGRGAYRVRHPGAGEHVEASLSKQVLVFAQGDRPVAVYPISSGKPSTPTVTGHFHFYLTQPGYNQKGMYYSFYFYNGYAVHGYAEVPDYPASHGCIRTFIADQPQIFDRIHLDESIYVF